MKRTPCHTKSVRNFRPRKQQRTVPDEERLYFSVKMNGSSEIKHFMWVTPTISPAIYTHCSLRTDANPAMGSPHCVTTTALLLLQDKFVCADARPYALEALRDRVLFGISQYYNDSPSKMYLARKTIDEMSVEKFNSLMGYVVGIPVNSHNGQMIYRCETFPSTERFLVHYYSEQEASTSETSTGETSITIESETSSCEDDYHFDNVLKLDLALNTLDLVANTLGQLSCIMQSRARQLRTEIS